MTLLKRSIAECCIERLVIEDSAPFTTESEFKAGPFLQVVDNLQKFVPVRRTALIEYFKLADAILDGQTAAIFKDGVHIAESYYSSHSAHRPAVDPERVIRIPGNQPVLVGFHGWHDNYYHWLTQCIPSLFWLRKICTEPRLLFALPALNSWQEQTLALAGLSMVDRYTVTHRQQYEAKELAYTTFTQGVTSYRPSHASTEVYRRMRSHVREKAMSVDSVVYVCRQDTPKRRMTNESELTSLLEAEGVTVMIPTHHSIAEQISLFANAKAVVGPHGAGLTNIIFCQPGATLYEIMADRCLNSCFANLASSLGMNYWGEAFCSRFNGDESRNEEKDHWAVDLQEAIKTVRRLMKLPSIRRG